MDTQKRRCRKTQEAGAAAYQQKTEHCDAIVAKMAEALLRQRQGRADAEHWERVYHHLRTQLIAVMQDPRKFDPAKIEFIVETGNFCF